MQSFAINYRAKCNFFTISLQSTLTKMDLFVLQEKKILTSTRSNKKNVRRKPIEQSSFY